MKELPDSGEWQFEPKWDGFRGVLENDGGELALWSRNGRPLLRYFPELRPLGDLLPPHSALDGEIVIARDGVLDFDSMQMRLHPAESRVRKLVRRDPSGLHRVRPPALERQADPRAAARATPRRARASRRGFPSLADDRPTRHDAQKWLDSFEAAGLDGVIAKKLGLPYLPGSRDGVLKVKPFKTADCVIVGVRWKEKPTRIATLLLGLYDEGGKIDYVGSAAVAASKHKEIFDRVEPLAEGRTRPWFLRAQPLGKRRAAGIGSSSGARRRGSLRQGAGQPLPPRLALHPLPRRQGSRPVHVA